MSKKYKAEDILNYLETIDKKSFNQIYKNLDKKERKRVDREVERFVEETTTDSTSDSN